MDFTERMQKRNRAREGKCEAKESVHQATFPLKEVHHNSVTTIASTSGSNKVTIETTVTMRKLPKRTSNSHGEDVVKEEESAAGSCTECESELTEEKENEASQDPTCPLRQGTKSRLERLGVLYSDDPTRLSSPIHRSEERFLSEEEEPLKKSAKSTARSARLAALAETINHWEDDIRQHPVGERSGLKSPPKSSVLTKHMVFSNKKSHEEHRRFISPQRATSREAAKKVGHTSSGDPLPSILKRPMAMRTSPQTKQTAKVTKSIIWDKTVIDALEDQGFARSESKQRLIYNYNNEDKLSTAESQPSRDKSPVKASSPLKATTTDKAQSPKSQSPINRKSPIRNTSPVKGRYGSPIQMGTSVARSKDPFVPPSSSGSSDEDAAKAPPTMGVKQLRSPRKLPTSPGSVLDQVNRYEQATSPTKRTKDPAELPLAQRMALFERNSSSAPVLPKAPFAMPVPVSKLHSTSSGVKASTNFDLQRKQPSSFTASSSSRGDSTSSLHDRLAVFEKAADMAHKGHMRDILSERQKEMEMLKHRWDKYKGTPTEPVQDIYAPSAPPMSPVPPPPPMPSPPQPFDYGNEGRHSGYYYEEDEEQPHKEKKPEKAYPVLKEVKKFKVSPPKPGHIYPCLSDMETESEIQESEVEENDNNRSSSSSDISHESDISSLGKNIVKLSQSSLKRDWSDQSGNEDNEIDDFLDEALESSTDEPTPPKRTSYAHNVGSVQSRSFEYSSNVADQAESNHPLLHTVSFYRRQQNMTLKNPSPVKHIDIDPSLYSTDDSIERMEEELDRELKRVEEKIEILHQEVKRQQTIISQASQALNLCYSTIEFSGSTEQLEAEKLLLLASQRRQAALHEIQRLKVEQSIRPQGPGNKTLTERGSLSLSQITVPLKMDVVHHAAKDDQCYYVLCLVHSDERVLSTNLMCAPRNLRDRNKLTFPDVITLDGLYSDFKVTVEVYTMTARSKELIPHDVKYHINTNKKDASKLKLTPRKGKGDSKLVMPTIQSPGGPMAVRTSSFTMAGYVIFSLREIQRTQFTLNKNAYTSVLEGSLHLKIESEMSVDIEYRGFLTMFEDVSGFGAWHRRWCLLKGDKLSYWKYPDDEGKKFPLDTIELTACSTREVDIVARDVCARPNTFLLETTRPAKSTDVDSLVLVRNGNMSTIRHLLSADTKEERIQWCLYLNKALALMRAWGVSK